MIPFRLRLHNFLSYQEAVLEFQGLHTACICGANGAGKSSLLEAMTWALWGQSRAVLEDDVIHLGADEAQVDLTFHSRGQLYRVIRSRHRQQSAVLEFQIAVSAPGPAGEVGGKVENVEGKVERVEGKIENVEGKIENKIEFRSLTAKGVRATQQLIVQTLRLDYDTFINSAYLRQGRADEFMLKRPNERKQVLADLLKLEQYDDLAEKAKDRARQFRAQAQMLIQTLGHAAQELDGKAVLDQELATLTVSLEALQQEQERDQGQLQRLQGLLLQRQTQAQQLQFQQQERDRHRQAQAQLTAQQETLRAQQIQLQTLVNQSAEIETGYRQWQSLQQQEEQLSQTAQQYHHIQTQRQAQEQAHSQSCFDLQRQLERLTTQLQALDQQAAELQPLLAKAPEIAEGLEALSRARSQLKSLDQLEAEVSPLLQRQRELETQLTAAQTRVTAQLDKLREELQTLELQRTALPRLQAEFEATLGTVQHLEGRDRYREEVRNKGQERRIFLDRLQAHQREYEIQLAQIEQLLAHIEQPEGGCPCCEQPLDAQHRGSLRSRYQQQRRDLIDQITVVVDQVFVSNREIEVVREEYRAVKRELKGYKAMLERKGQLKQQLTAHLEQLQHYQSLKAKIAVLEAQITTQTYAPALQQEWAQLKMRLEALSYDDRNHALARGEVERWRWVQIKQSELRQTQKHQAKLDERRPPLAEARHQAETELQQLQTQQQVQVKALEQQLKALNYDPQRHEQIRQTLKQAQPWQLRQQELAQAQNHLPQLEQQQRKVAAQLDGHRIAESALFEQIHALAQRLEQTPDPSLTIAAIEPQLQNRRRRLDHHLAEQGRLQQRQQQLAHLAQQYTQQQTELNRCRHQQHIHQELVQAFGKSGIQALMIENLLPQLEQETNHILSRLSNHQLHVQFITQKAKRSAKPPCRKASRAAESALIDTLDIRIADAKGTRPYETYSGGEAFRVNFSIRLALAKLLAQRAGTSLQLLIVDEGFGTQDAEGCDRLIAALNTIAPDFACILTITHMPQFKEAFQARIEVSKTETGSKLAIAI